ncbi:hypothetical protein [Mycolicibacterium porcinum]|uniref:hypothetical protein n=1 Tax=Mycolicibacterium porcinum TaxID=39693 RepID=UPI0013F4C086|nr:hypothetical protein [Mycolicibacterium porcinum]
MSGMGAAGAGRVEHLRVEAHTLAQFVLVEAELLGLIPVPALAVARLGTVMLGEHSGDVRGSICAPA